MREFLLCRFCQFLPCLGHVLTLREDVSDKPQTRADFLVPLAAPLHRQYKTARTETRWHLLLKIRQMPIQTSASRGYVLFISGNKRHTKVLKLSAGLRTHPAECSKLGKTQIIKDAGRGMVRNTGFCDQNISRSCIHNRFRANVYLYNCPEEIPRYGCAATSGA